MLKNVGKDGFEILGQTGVPPVTYPDLAGMALGFRFDRESIWVESGLKMWPELILPRRARGAARKKVSVLTGNRFGWNLHA